MIYFQPSLNVKNVNKQAPIRNPSDRNLINFGLQKDLEPLLKLIKVKNKLYTLGDSFSTDEVNLEILSLSIINPTGFTLVQRSF